MKILAFFMGLLLIINSVAISGTIDPAVPDEKYIEYGSKFDHTGEVVCYDSQGMSVGSGVVYRPHWIITAAHVVNGMTNHSFVLDGKKYKITQIICHPEYKENLWGYHDIALCFVEEHIDISKYPDLYEDSDEAGKVCAITGMGFTGNFNTGVKIKDYKKRAGSNMVDKTERNTLVCSPSRPSQKSTELEYLIASGDSGGGLFINNKLAGINSSVMAVDGKPNSNYGDESSHTRVSLYSKWIKKETETSNEKK